MTEFPPDGFIVTVPNLARLSDDALSALFPDWDGLWSAQTRALADRFKPTGIDLNDNWASTPPGWFCPCCRRYKAGLVRLSSAGVLLCHLEWHHDHLRDRNTRTLRARNPLTEVDDRAGTNRAIELCKGLLERFYPTLICQDCNAAEGKVKQELRGTIDPDFSFSPVEIATFVEAAPNAPHKFNVRAAATAWDRAEGEFADLVAFAAVLAERIAAGAHRKTGHPPHFMADPSTPNILRRLARAADGGAAADCLVYDLKARSISRQGQASGERKARSATAPTDADYVAFEKSQDPRTPWVKAPADWRCAACERDRRQIMRRSNARAWTGKLHQFTEYLPESDPEVLWRLSEDIDVVEDDVFGDHEVVLICGDCRQLITDVKTHTPSLTEASWSLADLRRLVAGAVPNARHDVSLEATLAVASANGGREHAAAAYHKRRADALSVRHDVEIIQRRDRCSVEDALRTLAWDDAYSAESNANWLDHLRWLRSLSDRYADRPYPN
jgi:rubredoxin